MYKCMLVVVKKNGFTETVKFERVHNPKISDFICGDGAVSVCDELYVKASAIHKISLIEIREFDTEPEPKLPYISAATQEAQIYVALPPDRGVQTVWSACQRYCNEHKLCVRVTECKYIFDGDGLEKGVEISLLTNPRHPAPAIRHHALDLARILKTKLQQKQIIVVTPTETQMLCDDDLT